MDTDHSIPNSPDRLNGWKEIAAHLRKSVRSVQRWESDYGLPVNRIKTPDGGQIIYAFREDIDAWLQRTGGQPSVRVEKFPNSSEGGVGAAEKSGAFVWRFATAVLTIALATVTLVWAVRPSHTRDPHQFALGGRLLQALDSDGATIWQHDFGRDVTTLLAGGIRYGPVKPAIEVDVDGDGLAEFLVPLRTGPSGGRATETDELVCFRRDGTVLWSVRPETVLKFGDEEFRAPWSIEAIVAARQVGPKRVWVAYRHHSSRPSFVIEVSPAGAGTLRFVQAGWIYALEHWVTAGATYLAAGGINNEYERSSVALLGDGDPPSHSPQTPGTRFECHDCPTGLPREYILFPPSEVAAAGGLPYNEVRDLLSVGDNLKVSIAEYSGSTIGLLRPDLSVAELERGGLYWQSHRELELAGKIRHSINDCPEAKAPRLVRIWTKAGWSNVTITSRSIPRGEAIRDPARPAR